MELRTGGVTAAHGFKAVMFRVWQQVHLRQMW